MTPPAASSIECSICGKPATDVAFLIRAESREKHMLKKDIYICDGCVDRCAEMIAEARAEHQTETEKETNRG